MVVPAKYVVRLEAAHFAACVRTDRAASTSALGFVHLCLIRVLRFLRNGAGSRVKGVFRSE